jgi:quercetin dioxygenase-like cupin family protein
MLPVERQPLSTEIKMLDGIFVKSMVIQRAGDTVPQHSHVYDHISVLIRGSVRVWRDDLDCGEYQAPAGLTIKAFSKHRFMALEDDTAVLCVHDIGTAESVAVADEHHLSEEE